jgi:hypothetical protein
MLPSQANGDTSRWYDENMSGMAMGLAAVKAFDARALSEAALVLCGVGALGVWIGLRFDRYVFRWAGMAVIVVGLLGLIFQNSLSRQTQAADLQFPTAPSASPTPSLSPSPSPRPSKKPPRKPTRKPTHKPAPPIGGGGGFTPPPTKPPSQPPLPPVQGSPVPPP